MTVLPSPGTLKENAGKVKSQPVKAAAAKDGPSR